MQQLGRLAGAAPPNLPFVQESVYWTQLTGLTHLRLTMGWDTTFPEMTGMTSVRILEIYACVGIRMPSSAMLSGLTSLRTKYGIFPHGVPAALEAAVNLRVLDLGQSSMGIELSDSDLMQLMSLPVLETLYLWRSITLTQKYWSERIALLRAKWAALDRAPPDIHDLESLT